MLHIFLHKKNVLFRLSLLSLVGLLATLSLTAQTDQSAFSPKSISEKKLNKDKWAEITKEIDYSGIPQDLEEEKRDTTDQFGENEISERKEYGGDWSWGSGFFRAFAIIFLIAVAALVIIYILNGQISTKANPKVKRREITLENIEENIHETELERFIREAIQEKNYALAIRLYYLSVIKELSLKKRIKWKRDKTNGAYLRETRGSDVFTAFRELTNIFERIRYGDGQVQQEDFLNLEPKFKQLIRQINKPVA